MRLLVTGGASGLGRAVALAPPSVAPRSWLPTIDRAGAEAAAQACGGHALTVDLIANAEQAVAGWCAPARRARRGSSNNAGFGRGRIVLEMKAETWDRTLGLNVKALALATAAGGPHHEAQRSGRIVNITLPASRMALPNYNRLRGLEGRGRCHHARRRGRASAPYGIRVNSLAPGMMIRPLQRLTEEALARIEGRNDIEAYLAERTARIPVGRADRAGGGCQDRGCGSRSMRRTTSTGRAAERIRRTGQGLTSR